MKILAFLILALLAQLAYPQSHFSQCVPAAKQCTWSGGTTVLNEPVRRWGSTAVYISGNEKNTWESNFESKAYNNVWLCDSKKQSYNFRRVEGTRNLYELSEYQPSMDDFICSDKRERK